MGILFQSAMGTRFLGAVPSRDRIGRTPVGCLGRGLRRRTGHAVGRYRQKLCAVRTDPRADSAARYNVDNGSDGRWERAMLRSGRDPKTGMERPGWSESPRATLTLRKTLKHRSGDYATVIDQRQAETTVHLDGMPPSIWRSFWDDGPIPRVRPRLPSASPPDLGPRRPDVRQAERLAAAQAEKIGIAQADLYPPFMHRLPRLPARLPNSLHEWTLSRARSAVFPMERLNYGRIATASVFQDANFHNWSST